MQIEGGAWLFVSRVSVQPGSKRGSKHGEGAHIPSSEKPEFGDKTREGFQRSEGGGFIGERLCPVESVV